MKLHRWKENLKKDDGTLLEFNVRSVYGSAILSSGTCHVNSCAPSDHRWNCVTSPARYKNILKFSFQ
jgi:hypothetical protein